MLSLSPSAPPPPPPRAAAATVAADRRLRPPSSGSGLNVVGGRGSDRPCPPGGAVASVPDRQRSDSVSTRSMAIDLRMSAPLGCTTSPTALASAFNRVGIVLLSPGEGEEDGGGVVASGAKAEKEAKVGGDIGGVHVVVPSAPLCQVLSRYKCELNPL